MAKEDFCFTYYDGDACRDMSHMNRLERGAYNDIVLQQRKFGRMTLETIKKILGKDFDEVWPAINLILICDEGAKTYHIEWLEKSIKTMRTHSKLQSERRNSKKSTEQQPDDNQTATKLEPDHHLKGDESVDENGVEEKIKKERLEKLNERLIEVYVDPHKDGLKMAYREVDVDAQWSKFQVKVRGAPAFYSLHTVEGLRMAFQKHLEGAGKKQNNKHPIKKFTIDELNQK